MKNRTVISKQAKKFEKTMRQVTHQMDKAELERRMLANGAEKLINSKEAQLGYKR